MKEICNHVKKDESNGLNGYTYKLIKLLSLSLSEDVYEHQVGVDNERIPNAMSLFVFVVCPSVSI
jgi:hypothetical protein